MQERLNTFRQLHDGSQLLLLPNAWDAASARLIESVGARAIATSSAGVAWAQGYADGGAMPASVAIAAAASIARVLTVPLSVDIENGYSDNAQQVADNVMRLIDIGAVGINIEDGGKAPQLLASKIEAIKNRAARSGKDIFINARTDVYLAGLAPEGERVAETLRRAALYKEAGTDGLFVPGITLPDDIRQVVHAARLPLNVLARPSLPDGAALAALGVRRLSAGSGMSQVLMHAARGLAADFLATGSSAPMSSNAMPYAEIQGLFR